MKAIFDIFSKKVSKRIKEKKEEQKPKIIVDYREKNSMIISELAELGIETEVKELKVADLSAYLIAQSAAEQLARRLPAQRVMNQIVDRVMRAGAKGVMVVLSGRIGGAEIARREWLKQGRLPLATLRAKIDYGFAEALTTFGTIGVKVWIFKGEEFE